MGRSHPSEFVIEGGKFHLAEALFDAFKFKVRCLRCVGNLRKQGFIKEQAGKRGPNGERRRYWGCQYSSSSANSANCSRISCTEYISQARQQLKDDEFRGILEQVCQRFQPHQDQYRALQAYASQDTESQANLYATSCKPVSSPQTLPQKRKAEDEPPVPNKAARHTQVLKGKESSASDSLSLQSTLQHLASLLEMSKTWQKQHEMLTIFLASSSPPQPTPSSQTPSWPSPTLAPKHSFSSDATIPCTYPEDELSSSSLNPPPEPTEPVQEDPSSSIYEPPSASTSRASPLKVYVGAAVLNPAAQTKVDSASPSYTIPPTEFQSSPPAQNRSFDPIQRVKVLVQRFKQARMDPATATEKRRGIRQQAKAEGVLPAFQALLKQEDPTLPPPHHPELKRSERI
jgi:hypothetical protein